MLNEMMYQQSKRLPDLANLVPHESIIQWSDNQIFFIGEVKEIPRQAPTDNRMYEVSLHEPKSKMFILSSPFYFDGSMSSAASFILGLETAPSIINIVKATRFNTLSEVKTGDKLLLDNGHVITYVKKIEYAPFNIKTGHFNVYIPNPDSDDDDDENDVPESIIYGMFNEQGVCISIESEAVLSNIVAILKK